MFSLARYGEGDATIQIDARQVISGVDAGLSRVEDGSYSICHRSRRSRTGDPNVASVEHVRELYSLLVVAIDRVAECVAGDVRGEFSK
jgi:hypothetical protein